MFRIIKAFEPMLAQPGLLFPTPKRWAPSEGTWLPQSPITIQATGDPRKTSAPVKHLQASLSAVGFKAARSAPAGVDRSPSVLLRLSSHSTAHPQGYRLLASSEGVEIIASTAAGLHHGGSTLTQWLALGAKEEVRLPLGEIEDWPDLDRRAVLLDVSRDKVPTLATLTALADRLAGWKVNELQLYFEHAFAYRGHEIVWRDASPLTPADIRVFDRHCRNVGIELVPNQNSFGHLHRWLVHEPYRRLAECPLGIEHPFSRRREPFSLCPIDPGAIALIEDLFDQLLPCFSSQQANVGLDETFDLGRCRSRQACARRGRETVYLEFLRRVHGLLTARRHRMQFWGDILLEHPERLAEVPDDVIPLAWGYEADHPFTESADRLQATGLSYYLCPGTSSWLSFGGRLDNALYNMSNAARAAHDSKASGLLIADWGDQGHLQPLPVSYLPLLAGAGAAWTARSSLEPSSRNWSQVFDRLVLPGAGLGELVCGLGRVHRLLGTPDRNGTALFHLLASWWDPIDHPRYRRLTTAALDRVEAALEELGPRRLESADPDGSEGSVRRELEWVAAALLLAVRVGRARLAARDKLRDIPPDERRALARGVRELVEERRALWLGRNRPGGLDDAVAPLDELASALFRDLG
ncbi:MAG TPA: glycoside hydrolase family 20 zincin-like fold domain-containing protein [Thermoanaerobaculia bacterium]|nr:glycoside hydrolase family 20 zincin-like fold domain-containing protein [Thermoanaerobaculia bacterium]